MNNGIENIIDFINDELILDVSNKCYLSHKQHAVFSAMLINAAWSKVRVNEGSLSVTGIVKRTMSDLANQASSILKGTKYFFDSNVSKSVVARAVNNLIWKDFVEKKKGESDRNYYIIKLRKDFDEVDAEFYEEYEDEENFDGEIELNEEDFTVLTGDE